MVEVKKTRWDKTYWVGIFRDGPHMWSISTDDGNDLKIPELFVKKSHAEKYYTHVCQVKLVEVK